MDHVARHPGSRLAEYAARHHIAIPPPVEGVWRAWIPDASNPAAGELAHAYTEAELLAKLTAALGG